LTLIAGRALKLTRCQLQGKEIPTQWWRSTDNVMVAFTAEQFLEFAEEADSYVEQVFAESWQKLDNVPNQNQPEPQNDED
jgi:hypothetical protein